MPSPDADGKYSAPDIDKLILDIYEKGSACGKNMSAVKDIYISAKNKYSEGGHE